MDQLTLNSSNNIHTTIPTIIKEWSIGCTSAREIKLLNKSWFIIKSYR